MSLLAWYPLNTDMKDYSGNERHLKYLAYELVQEEGKIGRSLLFNGDPALRIYHDNFPLLQVNFTWAFWIKKRTTNYAMEFILSQGRDYDQYGFNIIAKNGRVFILYGGQKEIDTGIVLDSKWTHIAVTVTRTKINVYKNGKFVISGDRINFDYKHAMDNAFVIGKMGYWYPSTASYHPINAYINDVRVYDNSLSSSEIYELSKALIVHYNFNNDGPSYTNLIKNHGYTIYNNYSQPATLVDTDDYFRGCRVKRLTFRVTDASKLSHFQSSLASHGIYGFSRTFLANKSYMFLIYFRLVTHPDTVVGGTASNIGNWTAISSKYLGDGWYVVGQKRKHNVDQTDSIFTSFYSPSLKLNEDIIIEFACPTLAENMYDYCDNPHYNYTEYGTLSDSSGHRNHSNTTSNISMKDGNVGGCLYIDNNGGYTRKDMFMPDNITFSAWFKSTSIGIDNHHILFSIEGTVAEMSITALGEMRIGFFINGVRHVNNSPQKHLLDGKWHLLTSTFDGTKTRGYIDGVKVMEHHNPGQLSKGSKPMGLGKLTDTSYGMKNAYLSDAKIYATALTDSDVSSLYKSRAAIFSKGEVVCNEMNENIMRIKIVKSIKAMITTNQYHAIYTDVPTGETNISKLVDSNYMLGNTYLEGWVYVSSVSYPPGLFEFTKENGVKGFQFTPTPKSGKWRVGWNFFSNKVTGYNNQATTPWESMTRLELYHAGNIPSSNTSEYIEYKDVYLVKRNDKSEKQHPRIDSRSNAHGEIREIGFPIRYIRDYTNGSTANAGNHWCEIKAFNGEVNVAKNKTVGTTNGTIVNGNLIVDDTVDGNYGYASPTTSPAWLQIDLHDQMIVEKIVVWHYYPDNRTYHNCKTQVSSDGVNWITLFDSSVEGEYQETSSGKTHYLIPERCEFTGTGEIISSEFIEI